MRKVLFVTAAFLAIVFFVSPPLAIAQKGKKSLPKHSGIPYIEREAEYKARDFWNSRITGCGSDYYTRDKGNIYQLKNSRVTVSSNSLSAADRLNGVEYSGYTYFSVGQSRSFSPVSTTYQNAGWSKWYDGFKTPRAGYSLGMYLRKESGYWRATPFSTNYLNSLQRVDCRDIYDYDYRFYERDDYYGEDNRNGNRTNNSIRTDNNSEYDNFNNRDTNLNYEGQGINWVRMSRGQSIPNNAISGGTELGGDNSGTTLYVCRAAYNGSVHPGKLLNGSCSIGFGGKEIVLTTFEVATGSGNWGKARAGYSGALVGGRETGRTLYVCRANFRESSGSGINYGQYPGKIVEGKCNFAFGTKELSSSDFDVYYPSSNYYEGHD